MCVCVCVCVFGREVCRGVESERIDSGDVGKREREREREEGAFFIKGNELENSGERACVQGNYVCVCVLRDAHVCVYSHTRTR